MATPNTLEGDVQVNGEVSCTTFTPPANSISDSHIAAGAAIAATKLRHRQSPPYSQPTGAIVATETKAIHTVEGATGTLVSFKAVPLTKPASGSYTVDLQKSTGGGAFATVLSAVITINSSSVDRTPVAATISATGLVAGDVLQVVVTASTPTGSNGLFVSTILDEDAA